MLSRSPNEYLIAAPADSAAEDETVGLRRELASLDARLAEDKTWRALSQLDEREARGEPLQGVAGDNLRGALQSRLSTNRFYLARVKIAEALAILEGGSAGIDGVPAPAEPATTLSTNETAMAAMAPPQMSPLANAFRTTVKIKPKSPMLDVAPLTQIAAALAGATGVLASPVTAAPPEKVDAAQHIARAPVMPAAGDSRSARPADDVEQLDGASAQGADLGIIEPAAASPQEQANRVPMGPSDSDGAALDAAGAAIAPGEDAASTARLRQIAAWRHADVMRARGASLSGDEGVPASCVPFTGNEAGPSAPAQHEAPESSVNPLAQLHWIKGIDGDLARQLEALGVGDPSKNAVGDPSKNAVGDPGAVGAADQDAAAVSDQDAATVSAAQRGIAQISRWRAADVARINSELRLGNRPSAENWIEQAAYLAGGRMTRYAARVASGETAAVVAAPEAVGAPAREPKALRKPVFSIPDAAAGPVPEARHRVESVPSPDAISADASGYTGDFLSDAYRTPALQPQAIPPVFEIPQRAEMVSAFESQQRAPPPDHGANAAETAGNANEPAQASAFIPARRGDRARGVPQVPSGGGDPVALSTDADPFGNSKDRDPRTDAVAETFAPAGFEQEAEVVILARENAAQDPDAMGGGQLDAATPAAAPADLAPPPPRRENRIESHAAYHSETDEASVVIVSRDKGDEAPDLAFYKQNEHWQREGTIRKFLKALTGD